jgi:spore coat polysaccharide biosynthesis protein SpsF
MQPRVIAVIQARMGSSRLPGKILAEIVGQTMLARVFARTSMAASVTETVIATTTDETDDPVVQFCEREVFPYLRGSLFDVLDRYHQAAIDKQADVVVRITGDCPLIDPGLIDRVVAVLLDGAFDFVCNRLPPPWHRTFPIGLDVEACLASALARAWHNATQPQHREHVMPFLYEGVQLQGDRTSLERGVSPRGFRIGLLHHSQDFGAYRWTVDTAEDLKFVRRVFERLDGRDDFSWTEVLDMVHADPSLQKINQDIRHNTLTDIDGRAAG